MAQKWFVTALLSVALFAGCTKKQKSDYGLDISETFRFNLQTEPPTLDWNKSTDTTSSLVQDNIMAGLADYDYDNPELPVVPALAESWESSKDQKKWTFVIRSGVKWTDGVELTAQQFVDGWERLLNPGTASEYAYFLYNVRNARQYNEGKLKDFAQVGVKVIDGKLVVELERPQSFFPALLNHHSTFPVRKELIEKFGDRWTDPENLQTLGAFKLRNWDHDKAIVFERNEDFYGEKAKVKYMIGFIVNEVSTALNMFQTGKIDFMYELPSLEIQNLRNKPEYRVTPINGIYYLGFNVTKAPFDNVNYRKAIAMAINREEITNMLAGGQQPINGWLPVGMMGYDPAVGVKFNPEEARKHLALAGYGEGKRAPKVVFGFNTNENHQRIAENIQAQLKKNLGVDMEIKNEEWKVYLSTLRVDAYPIFRMGWIADFADPDNFLGLMLSYSENNRGRWKNKKFDEIVERAVSIDNKEERKKLYLEAQRILVEEDVPVIPIYSYVNNSLTSSRVKGVPYNSMNRWKFRTVEIK